MPGLQINLQSVFHRLFQNSSNGIAVMTREGEWIEANRTLCSMLGYSKEELMKLAWKNIVHPEDPFGDLQEFLDEMRDSLVTEGRFIHKNGSVIWMSVNIMQGLDEVTESPSCMILQFTDISGQKELERQMLTTERRFQLIADNCQDIIYQSSTDGVILYASPSVQDMLGYAPDELIGMSDEVLYHPQDLQRLHDQKLEPLDHSQFLIRHKNGKYLWFEAKIKQETDESGTAAVTVIGREITQRKKHEDIIAEAQRIALIGSWEWDIIHNQVSFSDQLCQIYGIEPSDSEDYPFKLADLVPSGDQQRFQEEMEQVLQGNDLNFEFRAADKDGLYKYYHIRGVVSFSDKREPKKINGTVQDITDRKQVELKLLETVERYTSLKKYNHDAIVSIDLDGNIINCNSMAQELTGYQIHEMVGQNFSLYTRKNNIQDILASSLTDASAEKTIDEILHKDGHSVEVLTTIAPIIINNENVGYYLIAKDITEQKKLMIAKETAESTNKAKSEFLAMMSHEIRTPMNGVIGMTDLLMETTALTAEQKEYLEIIRKSGDTLLTIINDILDFSKIDSGKTELVEEALDIRACIFESVDVLAPKAQEKKLNISFSLSQDVPAALVGDSKRLKQVLMNLIGNAIKFTSSGGVSISVQQQERRNKKVTLKFMVKDTGIGIPKDKISQLFQPFYQLQNFMTRESEGTGLGLAISKKLVNLMGGEIWVEETEEPGATFAFTVTLKEPRLRHEAESGLAAQQEQYLLQGPLRILVAEDNKINQLVLLKILENQKHTVRIAETGNEAVEAALSEPFDAIFMDVHMPGMNGLEATTIIKDAMGREKCPVIIAVTANALKGDREKCLTAGMDEYLSKPINTRAVFDMIKRFFPG